MHVSRLQCVLATLALLPAMAGAQLPAPATGPEPTLHAMLESAIQRSPLARALDARQHESQAARDLSAAWLAGAPSLGLAQRNGRRETELSIAAPLWLPQQKSLRTALAESAASELAAQITLARLDMAGQVRQRLWEAAAARETLAEKEEHVTHLEQLAADVQRRIAAGDMARSDGLLMQQEVLAARNDAAAARLGAAQALARWRVLTGMALPAAPAPEALAEDAAAAPLRQQAAQASEQRARAAVAAAHAQAEAAPTVAVSIRRDRSGSLAPPERSIGIALQVPLTGRLRNRPAETAAATQLAQASAELAQAQAESEAALQLARDQLALARQSVLDAEQRAAAMREHTRLTGIAFHAGERGLAELLRSRALEHEAQVALRQQRVALGQAHAGLNQALGLIP